MKFPFNDKEYYIDGWLSNILNSIAYNLKNDWDIVLMITGDRSVRVGKSVLAITVCAYLSHVLKQMGHETKFDIDDVYFDNEVMVAEAQKKPKYAINLYDEGREGLAAVKSMKGFQQDLVDFFTECGQLNQIFVIVAPDFFEMKETISVGRSECLINVYRKDVKVERDIFKTGEKLPIVRFERGFFEFFNRKTKQILYDRVKSTRRKSYGLVKSDFIGRFTNQYPIDEELYRKKKKDSLSRFNERKKEQKVVKSDTIRDKLIYSKHKEGLSHEKIVKFLEEDYDFGISTSHVQRLIKNIKDKGAERDTVE